MISEGSCDWRLE